VAKVIKPTQLSAALRGEATGVLQDIRRGARLAAHRGRGLLIATTDAKGITDRGMYRNSFRVLPGDGAKTLATLVNDSPYAGIIEMGARPHKVSKEGVEAIAAWVRRKLAVGPVVEKVHGPTGKVTRKRARISKDAAMGIAYAIARKIAREGQKGRFVVGENLQELTRYLQEEVEAQIHKRAAGKGGAP
jgi:hypothetical protein